CCLPQGPSSTELQPLPRTIHLTASTSHIPQQTISPTHKHTHPQSNHINTLTHTHTHTLTQDQLFYSDFFQDHLMFSHVETQLSHTAIMSHSILGLLSKGAVCCLHCQRT